MFTYVVIAGEHIALHGETKSSFVLLVKQYSDCRASYELNNFNQVGALDFAVSGSVKIL